MFNIEKVLGKDYLAAAKTNIPIHRQHIQTESLQRLMSKSSSQMTSQVSQFSQVDDKLQ